MSRSNVAHQKWAFRHLPMRSRQVVRQVVASAAAGGPMPIEPGEHEVSASIDATFALEQTRQALKPSTTVS